MNCPNCGAWSKVLDTRTTADGFTIWRRHQCANTCKPFKSVQVLQAVYGSIKQRNAKVLATVQTRVTLKKRNDAIRKELAAGVRPIVLSIRYRVSTDMVSRIKRGLER